MTNLPHSVMLPDMSTAPHQVGVPQWTLGDRLAKARKSARLSVAAMAADLGVDAKTVNNYEAGRGKRGAPRSVIIAYHVRTGVPLSWLTGEGPDAGSSVRTESNRTRSSTATLALVA